jgi:hypothetical protein
MLSLKPNEKMPITTISKANKKLVSKGSWAYTRGSLFLIDRFIKNLEFLQSFLYDTAPMEPDLFFIF